MTSLQLAAHVRVAANGSASTHTFNPNLIQHTPDCIFRVETNEYKGVGR